jgi:hypothetical protein
LFRKRRNLSLPEKSIKESLAAIADVAIRDKVYTISEITLSILNIKIRIQEVSRNIQATLEATVADFQCCFCSS